MAQQSAAIAPISPWTNPEVLIDLLDYFREQGYQVTTDKYALAQDLVLGLIGRGEEITDGARLKMYLSPVLCTNPREQANFPGHFDRWWARISTTDSATTHQPDSADHALDRAGNRWRKWKWILGGAGVLMAAALFWLFLHFRNTTGPETVPVITVPPSPSILSLGIILYAGLAIALTALFWGIWWYWGSRLFLRRRSSAELPDLRSVTVESQAAEWLDHVFLRNTARELRRRYPVVSSELAILPTVERTVRSGEFTPVFRARLVAPEYLVLIDRRNFKDHNALYLDEIIDKLGAEQVHIKRCYFDHDLRMVFSEVRHEPPTTLPDLAAHHRDSRIMLFTDCAGFFNPVSGELENWTESLWQWPHLAIFTPRPLETWGYQENLLAERASIVPATTESIRAFGGQNAALRARYTDEGSQMGPFPAELAERPNRWLERDAPSPSLVKDVLDSVRRFLGEDGYFWLCACAVYPEIHFNLTLYLGTNLRTAAGETLFNNERANTLFRLPWLRSAYMPDWLRLYLVRGLSKEQNRRVREVLNCLWLSVAGGSTKAINLEIARRHPRALMALASRIFQTFARQSPKESLLRDHVFACVMLGRSVDPLSVRIPRVWRRFLHEHTGDASPRKLSKAEKVCSRIIAGGLLVLVPIMGVLSSRFMQPAATIQVTVAIVTVFLFLGLWLAALILGAIWLNRTLLMLGANIFVIYFIFVATRILMPSLFFSNTILIFSWWLTSLGIWSFVPPRMKANYSIPWDQITVRLLVWARIAADIGISIAICISSDIPILVAMLCVFVIGAAQFIGGIIIRSRGLILHGLAGAVTIIIAPLIFSFLDQSTTLRILASATVSVLFMITSLYLRKNLKRGMPAQSVPTKTSVAA